MFPFGPSYNVYIIGGEKTGKTCLGKRFAGLPFDELEKVPSFDNYGGYMNYRFRTIPLNLVDSPEILDDADVCVVCYSVDDRESFKALSLFGVKAGKSRKGAIIVVGNKIDLRYNIETINKLDDKGLSPITALEGAMMATEMGAFSYVECSAKMNIGIKEVFEYAIEAAIDYVKPKFEEKPRSHISIIRRHLPSFQDIYGFS